jgi:hypothetical protein
VRVPIDEGRCLWIGEDVTTTSGVHARNVGFLASPEAPLGSCPATPELLGGSVTGAVTITGNAGSDVVQIDGGFVFQGETHVMYRLFEPDPTATFGYTLLGGGLGKWDASTQQIVVPGPDELEFYPDINLGQASLTIGPDVYMWGCHAPITFLTEPCALARLDASGVDYLGTNDTWIADATAQETATLFSDGPWIASVVPVWTGGFQHVYAVGFGNTLETDTATDLTGTWTAGPTLAGCDVPADDSHAFCAGPVVHEELADPTVGGQRVVTYGVGTTAATGQGSTDPDAYWTRLVWINP